MGSQSQSPPSGHRVLTTKIVVVGRIIHNSATPHCSLLILLFLDDFRILIENYLHEVITLANIVRHLHEKLGDSSVENPVRYMALFGVVELVVLRANYTV